MFVHREKQAQIVRYEMTVWLKIALVITFPHVVECAIKKFHTLYPYDHGQSE